MSISRIREQIKEGRLQASLLRLDEGRGTTSPGLLEEALETLRVAFKELRVADNKLQQQNEELKSARIALPLVIPSRNNEGEFMSLKWIIRDLTDPKYSSAHRNGSHAGLDVRKAEPDDTPKGVIYRQECAKVETASLCRLEGGRKPASAVTGRTRSTSPS